MLMLLLLPILSFAQTCTSFNGSALCKSFSSIAGSFSELSITTIQDFDKKLTSSLLDGTDAKALARDFGCPEMATANIVPRFRQTVLCSYYALQCVDNRSLENLMCQGTCNAYVKDLERVLGLVCKTGDAATRNDQIAKWKEACVRNRYYNKPNNCVVGSVNEKQCGFIKIEDGCRFCQQNASEGCCKDISSECQMKGIGFALPSESNLALIIGLSVVGGFLFLFLLFVGVCLWKRRDNTNEQEARKGSGSSGTNTATDIASQSNHMSYYYEPPVTPTKSPFMKEPTRKASLVSADAHQSYFREVSSENSFSTIGDIPSISTSQIGRELNVTSIFVPEMSDEIELQIGNVVKLTEAFDDGWAVGINMTTGEKGAFPIGCIQYDTDENTTRRISSMNF